MIRGIRLLPPLVIARLGSAGTPMQNYDAHVDEQNPTAFRKLTPARTLIVNRTTGAISRAETPASVRFKEGNRVKPIAPFLEVWCDRGDGKLRPLTTAILTAEGLTPADVSWRVRVGNVKAFRRTRDNNDKILADTGAFSTHSVRKLDGTCANFVANQSIPFGDVQYVNPTDEFPGIRLRFTPGPGGVYGSTKVANDPNVTKVVYDNARGRWSRYRGNAPIATVPGGIFATDGDQGRVSRGYLDDACDGMVEVEIAAANNARAFARISAGPPDYAPDSFPVRTIADELEQALLGPVTAPANASAEMTAEIIRRAFETVRLQNTAFLNGNQDGNHMAGQDTRLGRAFEPIMAPALVDNLALRNLHQSIYAALRGDTAAWFGQVLRDYDQAGDLTNRGRRKMPAMMRGADGLHLALTRRQVSNIRTASSAAASNLGQPQPAVPPGAPAPINQTAQAAPAKPLTLQALEGTFAPAEIDVANLLEQACYRAAGNPPGTLAATAISNCFPGLEFDFRNAWRRLFVEVELHETGESVVEGNAETTRRLVAVVMNGRNISLLGDIILPDADGNPVVQDREILELSNALAEVIAAPPGTAVTGVFEDDGGQRTTRPLTTRGLFAPGTAAIAQEIAGPGELTQSLCSPWQNDYRECACYYWAASRPDYVNVEPGADGTSIGHNWMQSRTASTPKNYLPDDAPAGLFDYNDLFRQWEQLLRFQIEGKDSE